MEVEAKIKRLSAMVLNPYIYKFLAVNNLTDEARIAAVCVN
jgi:hypothetical protein